MLLSGKIYNFVKSASNGSKLIYTKREFLKNFYTWPRYAAQVSFKLSDIGEGIREVTVKEWFVKVGDKVNQFDEICEVQSDKASVTITSRYDGIIKKLHYKIDDVALVGNPLVDIETEADATEANEQSSSSSSSSSSDEEVETKSETPKDLDRSNKEETKTKADIICIPSVRRLAKEHKIDLSEVQGSGKDGRILKEDVLKYLSSKESTKEVPITAPPSAARPVHPHVVSDRTEPIRGFQKAMVKTMTEFLKVPHFVYGDEFKVTKLSQLRKSIKELPEDQNLKLSYMPFFIKAVSNALRRYPIINSVVDEKCENITYRAGHNIGVAMDTKVGLAVPVIKNVQNLSIVEINQELNRLLADGKKGIFSTDDLSGGTFSISNIGAIGGTYTKPVIMPQEVALLATGASRVLPRFDESNNVVPEEIINVSAVADHRIIDGATMARFIQVVKRQIENPYLLFLDL